MSESIPWLAAAIGGLFVLLYAARVNYLMGHPASEAEKHAGQALTPEYIGQVYKRVAVDGIVRQARLPPKQNRRYIVVGGSGLVGGRIVLDLLDIGTPPEAVRIIDCRKPFRDEFLHGEPSQVDFVKADITSEEQTFGAFEHVWPATVSDLPLTVFHTAAVIRQFERYESLYYRCARVNVGGTAHVLSAARKVGAGIFIGTSSSAAGQGNVGFFLPPWRRHPRNYVQFLNGRDFFHSTRNTDDFPSNYARSKAESERLVCAADEPNGMRTGAIRPGNAVYGHRLDGVLGRLMKLGRAPTHGAAYIQNWCSAGNASLAHVQYEAAMLGPHADENCGRPYLVTDNGPPVRFSDVYAILSTATTTGFRIYLPPPLFFMLCCYAVETFSLLVSSVPLLQLLFREPGDPINVLQPGTVASGANCILDDSEARKSPEQGGIGYSPACTTVEGICAQVAEWNKWVEIGGRDTKAS